MKLRLGFRSLIILSLSMLLVLSFQNCGDVRLGPPGSSETNIVQQLKISYIKSLEGSSISSNIRTIFVVDTSGSNAQPSPPGVIPASGPSDPDRTRRFNPIRNFVSNAQGPTNKMFWSLLLFNTTNGYLPASRPSTNNATVFLNDSVQAALSNASLDGGNTKYIEALEQVKVSIQNTAIAEAARNPPESSTYQIFFVSDGAPGERNLAGAFIPQPLADIERKMQELMNLKFSYRTSIDGIQLHTGLYFGGEAPEAGAQEALQRMASLGEGRFLEFSGDEDLDFTNFSGLTRSIHFEYRDLWVLNRNAVWEQFSLKRDSDGDGLSDQMETSLGSDPNLADSDGNGVTDAVERRVFGSSCGAELCAETALRRAFPQCTGTTPYPDTDYDLLNDCEERLLGSHPSLFDSNGQGLPDILAFRNGMSLTNSGALYLDPDFDRQTSYMEIKRGLPPLIPNSQLSLAPLIDVGVSLSSVGQNSSDYQIDFRQLPYLNSDDQMILFWIEETPNIVSRRVLRVFEIQKTGTLIEAGDRP